MIDERGRPRLRLVALLAAGMVLAALMLTPGMSVAAKFLTKKKADRRYLNVREVVAAGNTLDTRDR